MNNTVLRHVSEREEKFVLRHRLAVYEQDPTSTRMTYGISRSLGCMIGSRLMLKRAPKPRAVFEAVFISSTSDRIQSVLNA
jgi:hypothetical protein